MKVRRPGFFAFILPALPHLVFLGLGKVYFFDDLLLYFLPSRVAAARWLKAGYFPIWDPYTFCGYPFLGNIQSALLYPFHMLFLLLPGPIALHLSIALHYGWAGLGMYRLVRSCGGTTLGGVAGAVIYGLSGPLVAHAVHLTVVCVLSWAPWVLYGVRRYCERQDWKSFLFPLLMAMLSGHPEMMAKLLIVTALWSLYCSRGNPSIVLKLFALFALVSLISMPQFLPGMETFLNSLRRAKAGADALFTYPPLKKGYFLHLLFPWPFGNYVFGSFLGKHPWQWWEYCGYVGLFPLLLLFKGKKKVFRLLALLLLFLAFVPSPRIELFGFPSRWLPWWALTTAAHAGIHFEEGVRWFKKHKNLLIAGFFGLLSLMLFLSLTGFSRIVILKGFPFQLSVNSQAKLQSVTDSIWATFIIWWSIFFGGLLLLASLKLESNFLWLGLVCLEFFAFTTVANPTVDLGKFLQIISNAPKFEGRVLRQKVKFSLRPDVMFVRNAVMGCIPNTHLFGPTFSASGYDPLQPRFVGFLMDAPPECGISTIVKSTPQGVPVFEKVKNFNWPPLSRIYEQCKLGKQMEVGLKLMREEKVYFETLPNWEGGKVAIFITGFPGWKGWIDGRKVFVWGMRYSSDTKFLAIYVPEGKHRVWIIYRPASFVVGLFLGLLGVAFLTAFGALKDYKKSKAKEGVFHS